MRKIISYIASQYKKDKIWMRRTKPSKRTYQIMLSIDDSLSMAESHSIQMAFESLAIIAKAMSQLEVGQICISSFGQDVKLVHPFECVLSDEAGAEVIRSFAFDQESTNVKLLMDQSLEILKTARSDDNWQLQIILSDGKCEEHEYIHSRVRAAADDKIAMVFVILDCRENSIVDLEKVDFEGSEMRVTKYMDSFPFDYFIVVKNVNKLPEVLADTLRQFFAMVSN